MTSQYKVGTTDQLDSDGSRIITEVEGIEIAVFRLDGEFHAIANHCIHQAGPLCEGPVTGQLGIPEGEWMWQYDDTETIIECPWHAWKFDITSGENIDNDQYSVPTFDVHLDDTDIYVKLPE